MTEELAEKCYSEVFKNYNFEEPEVLIVRLNGWICEYKKEVCKQQREICAKGARYIQYHKDFPKAIDRLSILNLPEPE